MQPQRPGREQLRKPFFKLLNSLGVPSQTGTLLILMEVVWGESI
jgi:hypothetical protein